LRIEASKIPKFSLTEVVAEFEMDPMAERPLDDLETAVEEQIKQAIAKSEELYDGRKVYTFQRHLIILFYRLNKFQYCFLVMVLIIPSHFHCAPCRKIRLRF
jgi:hypothetical protein